MTLLADAIAVAPRFARSANLERDATRLEPLRGYVVTARALDVTERIATAAAVGGAGGAWSLTGPYGSGKSSLGLLLDAAFGPADSARRMAVGLVGEASEPVSRLVEKAHEHHGTADRGFHRGLVTARREPLSRTVLRALAAAVSREYGTPPPAGRFGASDLLAAALDDAASDDPRRGGPSATALVEIARCLASDRPLLLILDEFGKNLEAARGGTGSDPYLLQQLAEAGQGSGLPILLLTLQHLSFEDHLAGADGAQRREWAKVQGRFEDVAYVESAAQTRALIGTAFEVRDTRLADRIARWADREATEMRRLGIAEMSERATVASCYPLHPLTALVLPELCGRYGQHERTLFSFLTGADPASAASFLNETELPQRGRLPSLGLEAVYDYFVAGGHGTGGASRRSGRWVEIATRLRDTHGLTEPQRCMTKSVAVLNLVSSAGPVRASAPLLARTGPGAVRALAALEAAGVLTHRRFADEYRLWQGTDVDISHLLEVAGEQVASRSLVDVLSGIDPLAPQVAARHSAEHGTLRVFSRRYVDGSEPVEPPSVTSPYDGEVLVMVGKDPAAPTAVPAGTKPVVVATPGDVGPLEVAAREVATVTAALEDPSVAEDWVARRELGERLAQAQTALEGARTTALSAATCRWVLLGESGETELSPGRGSAALSEAADLAYTHTPPVRNEMLNRTALTSQGAKARRELLEAMIDHSAERDLGLSGFGPEVAMYRAFLARTGLHAPEDDGHMGFRAPSDPKLQPAWEAFGSQIERAKRRRLNVEDLFATLVCPPVGMKAGAVAVFITAGLLARRDDVALYEHGTFKPQLTAEVSERMVRNPGHFDLKCFANTTGARRQILEALAARLDVQPLRGRRRVAAVVAVVGHLVARARALDNYTRRTTSLPVAARDVRDALLTATEPDDLLFDALPSILGFPEVAPDARRYPAAGDFAAALGDCLGALEGCLAGLLGELLDLLLTSSGETSRLAVAGQAAALDGEVLDSEVRAFVAALANDGAGSDAEWVSIIATVVARKAPAEWTDEDRKRFSAELPQRLAAFGRLVALHAERRADGGGPFDALRVTVTRPDGTEYVRLVGVDQQRRGDLDALLDDTLAALAQLTGSTQRAGHTLLALLGERFLAATADAPGAAEDPGTLAAPRSRARHG